MCACVAESVAYSFGHSGGLITYTFPDGEWPDSKTDRLALGFITTQRTAVLVRIVSGSSNDYIEMELVSALALSLSTSAQETRRTDAVTDGWTAK